MDPQAKIKLLKSLKTERELALYDYISSLEKLIEQYKNSLPDLNKILSAVKGQQGEPGYTPKKGKDYFTKQELTLIEDRIRLMATPVKGKDYFDGKPGYTPVKNVDYFDGINGRTPIKNVDYFDGKQGDPGPPGPPGLEGPPGPVGPIPKHEVSSDKSKIRFENPDGTWGEWVEAPKGGTKVSRIVGGVGGYGGNPTGWFVPTGTRNGSNKDFTVPSIIIANSLEVSLNGQLYFGVTITNNTAFSVDDAPTAADDFRVKHLTI